MKISFFIGSMGGGGAERVISLLANDYARRGWDVDIVMLRLPDVDQSLDPQVKLVNLNGPYGSYLKNAAWWLKNIRSYLKKRRPDRVVSFIGRINALVLTAALGLKASIVVSERNDPRHDGRGAFMLRYCNWIYPTARAVVFQTEAEEACFTPAVREKGVIIPNPVNVEGAVKMENPVFTVITAGRLAEQKNHKMLLDAMARVHREDPLAKCVIFGEGHLRSELERHRDALGLGETVSLPGHSTQVRQHMAESSVFVLTSEFEGLSNALLEGMLLGLPCVTTDYPGADEVIMDGETGLIIPRGDAAALAEKLLLLIRDPELARRLGRNAQAQAQQYKTENVIHSWRAVIEEDASPR